MAVNYEQVTRNHLAHSRLPDIDEGLVRRFTWSRLGSLRETIGTISGG